METKNFLTSLIVSLILLIAAGAVIYFLDMPQYQKIKQGEQNIQILYDQLTQSESRNKAIAEVVKNLETANWNSIKKKIEPNFSSDPFYLFKMEVFFKDSRYKKWNEISLFGFSTSSPVAINSADKTNSANKDNTIHKTPLATSTSQTTENSASAAVSSIKTTTVNLEVAGTYEQLKQLLTIMETQAYLISVKTISFEGGSAITKFLISADIYSY